MCPVLETMYLTLKKLLEWKGGLQPVFIFLCFRMTSENYNTGRCDRELVELHRLVCLVTSACRGNLVNGANFPLFRKFHALPTCVRKNECQIRSPRGVLRIVG